MLAGEPAGALACGDVGTKLDLAMHFVQGDNQRVP